jgi:hypothetical protein
VQGFFLTLFVRIEHTSSSAHELRLFLELPFICVHPQLLSLLRSISSWWIPSVYRELTRTLRDSPPRTHCEAARRIESTLDAGCAPPISLVAAIGKELSGRGSWRQDPHGLSFRTQASIR